MLAVRIIPCLDVKDGRVVKGVNFEGLRDAGDPVEAAKAYDAAGADELCFLDITASHEGRGTLLDIVRRTADACFMPLTVGGGVSEVEDIRNLLLAGADKVSINTAAVKRRAFVDKLDFITSPGHQAGRAGAVLGGGPTLVITDKGMFDFGGPERSMRLVALYPGITLNEVRAEVAWALAVADEVVETPAPSVDELDLMRSQLDPQGLYRS